MEISGPTKGRLLGPLDHVDRGETDGGGTALVHFRFAFWKDLDPPGITVLAGQSLAQGADLRRIASDQRVYRFIRIGQGIRTPLDGLDLTVEVAGVGLVEQVHLLADVGLVG